MVCFGVVDTTFARVDMGSIAVEELKSLDPHAVIHRITVPGVKNIPYAAAKLLKELGCDGVIATGWVGPALVDKLSYLAMSIGLVLLQLETAKPIVDVTVHEDEASDEVELKRIAIDRTKKHARNLVHMLRGNLSKWAGMGLRQGVPDVGPIL